ncbi:hypothetical protein MLD38_032958 [Melastoma candidum]|uniref:Uncharacterized protein n=1 Tax=Melastoma candidum TaxID=119954 RepID=A0ACB9M5U2_9MYRT|nr:hypothetical protein MLD38_032958 [Melastoma candidum]
MASGVHCGGRLAALPCVATVVIFFSVVSMPPYAECVASQPPPPPLVLGYYGLKCPIAERIVKEVVSAAARRNPGILAGLIRMYFHDCFVRGCDASVLLKSADGQAERDHRANRSLQGFEIVEEIKSWLEAVCPMTVSCADILSFAARDSVALAGGIYYDVLSGRRDGLVSRASEVITNLPSFNSNAQQLVDAFAKKGLTAEEMVTLSGAHTIGVAHCSLLSSRLYNYNNTGGIKPSTVDPSMDPRYAEYLKTKCPQPQGNGMVPDTAVFLEGRTPAQLDNKYYQDLMNKRGMLRSDQTLQESPATAPLVAAYAGKNELWAREFAKAMVRLGNVEVLTGKSGEIRSRSPKHLLGAVAIAHTQPQYALSIHTLIYGTHKTSIALKKA